MRYRYPIDGEGTTTDQNGKILPGVTISLFLTGTSTPAKMYAASAGGAAVYSITSDLIAGTYTFWVDTNDYPSTQAFDIAFNFPNFAPKKIINIFIVAFMEADASNSVTGTALSNLGVKSLYVSNYASLSAAITAIGSTPTRLVIDAPVTVPIGGLTIPANLQIEVTPAGLITLTGNVVINGSLTAGSYQIFTGAGNVSGLKVSRPEWFGAAGLTNDSTAIIATYNSLVSGGAFIGTPGNTYLWDTELIVTKAVIFDGQGATIKLPDNSNLFNDYTNPQDRCLLHVRVSGVEIKGWNWNLNSPNNYKTVAGTKYYVYAVGGLWEVQAAIMVGFYGTAATGNIYNTSIHNNTFLDAPFCAISSRQLGDAYSHCNTKIVDNTFTHGQGPQVALSNSQNAIVSRNTFINPYDFTIQPYYLCYNTTITDNTTYFKSSEITILEVDPYLNRTGSTMLWFGQMRVGKGPDNPNYGTICSHNNSYGAGIYIPGGTIDGIIEGNNVYDAEDCGIMQIASYNTLGDATTAYNITQDGSTYIYTYSGTGTNPLITNINPLPGARVYFSGGNMNAHNTGFQDVVASAAGSFTVYNPSGTAENGKVSTVRWSTGSNLVIRNNNIYRSQFAGLYLGGSYFPVEVTGNALYGNHISAANYGGRVLRANIAIIDNMYNIHDNTVKQFNGAPLYGINLLAGVVISDYLNGSTTATDIINIFNNNIVGGGISSDFYNADGTHRGDVNLVQVQSPTAIRNFEFNGLLGTTKMFTYQNESIADDGTVNLPDATNGMVFVSCNAESGMWQVQSDGTSTKIAGSTNTAAADTDNKLCVFDGGTYGIVKNRLGATGKIRIVYFYY